MRPASNKPCQWRRARETLAVEKVDFQTRVMTHMTSNVEPELIKNVHEWTDTCQIKFFC